MENLLRSFLIIAGLVTEFMGVIILTTLTDRALDNLIDKMNKVVDESWDVSVKRWKKDKKIITLFGVGFLLLGLGLEIWANWATLWSTT